MFMGTPHRGSDIATLGRLFSRFLDLGVGPATKLFVGPPMRTGLLKMLSRDSESLGKVTRSFRERATSLEIMSCYETEALRGLGRLVITHSINSCLQTDRSKVVNQSSATLGFPQENLIPLRADHASLCRFGGRHESNYTYVSSALERAAASVIGETSNNVPQSESQFSTKCMCTALCLPPLAKSLELSTYRVRVKLYCSIQSISIGTARIISSR